MWSQGVQTVGPARAIVTPRGSSAAGGEVLPLEKHVRDAIPRHSYIAIVGPTGSGKTTAIRHLAHELAHLPITFLDREPEASFGPAGAIVFACTSYSRNRKPDLVLQIAPWGDSERVDYLLARHPTKIRSIMQRLEACDCVDDLEGSPRLWTAVLDWMAMYEAPMEVRSLLRGIYEHTLRMMQDREDYTRKLLAVSYHVGVVEPSQAPGLLWHRMMMRFALTEELVNGIEGRATLNLLRFMPDAPALDDLVRVLRGKPVAAAKLLERIARGEQALMPMGVSVAVAMDPGYRPPSNALNLRGAQIANAKWAGAQLASCNLDGADLRCADLNHAKLAAITAIGADFARADLYHAQLPRATLSGARLRESTLAGADLQGANLNDIVAHAANFNRARLDGASLSAADLCGASFVDASLRKAILLGTRLDACDFTRATLDGAMLTGVDLRNVTLHHASAADANLSRSNLENTSICGLRAQRASLEAADLTGASLTDALLHGVTLQGAGLAGVSLENADLRDAIFDNAAFHMGSSRSGLLDSPIACEGSRTGFYTDEAAELYKHPEEIRKANLCGANLVGARVEKTDWYLVDLRGAKYSTRQAMWFRTCGAILFDRT